MKAAAKPVPTTPVDECMEQAPYIGHDCDPFLADNAKVICPACCTQFRAIPVNVQQLMLDAGFEPPFTTPPATQADNPLLNDYVQKAIDADRAKLKPVLQRVLEALKDASSLEHLQDHNKRFAVIAEIEALGIRA